MNYSIESQLQNSGTQQNRPFEAFCDPAALSTFSSMPSAAGHGQPPLPSQTASKSSIFLDAGVLQLAHGARGSALSRAQVDEVLEELRRFHPEVVFEPIWVETTGDRDLKTSLRDLEKTDFFTKEIDAMQLAGHCRISTHSAKDLPEPLPKGLILVALTKGVDPSDSIVLRGPELPLGAKIGTSSARREQNIKELRKDLVCADIRGTILARLEQLDRGDYDGVVMAEAALIRLKLTHRPRIPLPGTCAALQGQLAVLARDGDEEMRELFSCIDVRQYENDLVLRN